MKKGRRTSNGRTRMPKGARAQLKRARPGSRMQRGQRFVLVSPSGRAFSGVLVARESGYAVFRGVR